MDKEETEKDRSAVLRYLNECISHMSSSTPDIVCCLVNVEEYLSKLLLSLPEQERPKKVRGPVISPLYSARVGIPGVEIYLSLSFDEEDKRYSIHPFEGREHLKSVRYMGKIPFIKECFQQRNLNWLYLCLENVEGLIDAVEEEVKQIRKKSNG